MSTSTTHTPEQSVTTTTVTSQDGTIVDVDCCGRGPAVVIVGGVVGDRSQQAPVAQLLAPHFTVYNYDRRGHGDRTFPPPYSVDGEVEDLRAVIAHAGGSACIYATSGCSVIALQAAATGVPITRLALWEPPFIVGDSRPPVPVDYRRQLEALLAQDRRGDMVALFLTKAAGIPAPFVEQLRQAPFWGAHEAFADTLVYDATMMCDFSIPATAASANVPTVVLDGGTTPWLTTAADTLAGVLPDARRAPLGVTRCDDSSPSSTCRSTGSRRRPDMRRRTSTEGSRTAVGASPSSPTTVATCVRRSTARGNAATWSR